MFAQKKVRAERELQKVKDENKVLSAKVQDLEKKLANAKKFGRKTR